LQQVLDNVSFTFVLTARLLLEKAHEGVVLEAFGVAVMGIAVAMPRHPITSRHHP
jgi:hypothetical protein